MRPIFHLSFPVRDLEEAIDFYSRRLGAEIGRRTPYWTPELRHSQGCFTHFTLRPGLHMDAVPLGISAARPAVARQSSHEPSHKAGLGRRAFRRPRPNSSDLCVSPPLKREQNRR